jgi:oligoribonuclease (3'-5' exoribonuclease)
MLLAFTDLETTHRQPDKGSIIEIATIITDQFLDVKGWYTQLVKPMPLRSESEDADVLRMHTENGLFADIARETEAGTILRRYEVELDLIEWLKDFGQPLRLVGNSIYFDQGWLAHHMPGLASRFHRHLFDITSINKFAELVAPSIFNSRPRDGAGKHRALTDAHHSLKTLRYYNNTLGDITTCQHLEY